MANSSKPANGRSSGKDGPHLAIPSGLNPRRLICLFPLLRPGFERLPRTYSGRPAVTRPFTHAFLLIAGSLPANYLAHKGLAEHIYSTWECEPAAVRVEMEASHPVSRGSCTGKVLDFRAKPKYGTPVACVRRPIRNL
jgi:hypothetical protein